MNNVADKILSRMRHKADAPKDNGIKPKMTFGRAMKYAFLPDLGSRIRDIGRRLSGFAYFLAQIFYSCRLIPAGHPTLQAANIGYFGFSDVIATAAANLQIRKENTDQIVIFSAVILSMVLLVANGLAIAAYAVLDVNTAFAQTAAPAAAAGSMFAAPNPQSDLALKFLDLMFGTTSVPFFGPDGSARGGADPVKEALYHMMGLYSTAMMVVAVVIILYYAFVVVGESAMTGQPFGKRFNSFWAPIRLVVGLGLLVPIAGGLNAAQYITLYAAKMGSGFASYAWSGFVQQLSQSNLISRNIAYPNVDELVTNIVRFETCKNIVNAVSGETNIEMRSTDMRDGQGNITGRIYKWDSEATWNSYLRMIPQFALRAAPVVGIYAAGSDLANGTNPMSMSPSGEPAACGELFIPRPQMAYFGHAPDQLTGAPQTEQPQTQLTGAPGSTEPGETLLASSEMQQALDQFFNAQITMVNEAVTYLNGEGGNGLNPQQLLGPIDQTPEQAVQSSSQDATNIQGLRRMRSELTGTMNAQMRGAVNDFVESYRETFQQQIQQRISTFDQKGWLGAGLFYSQIADINGGLMNIINASTARAVRDIVDLPSEREMLAAEKANSGLTGAVHHFFGGQDTAAGAAFDNESARAMQQKLAQVMEVFSEGDSANNAGLISYRQNTFEGMLVDMFGGRELMAFKRSSQVNPLADLVMLGHSLVHRSFSYISTILGLTVGGALLSMIPVVGGAIGSLTGAAASFFTLVATTGFAVGVMLAYMVPLLPFVFFFFSAIAWVLEVVEAMVGLPLWALAHIRIDGDGLSGQAAQTGYMIIFGILVRPFVILFAFIIGIIMYSVGMQIIKEGFNGYMDLIQVGQPNPLSYLIFCLLYAVLSFTLGMLCFKQCDKMTNNIMRWFGGSDPRYNDGQENPATTMQTVATSAGFVATQAANNIGQGVGGMAQGVGSIGKELKGRKVEQQQQQQQQQRTQREEERHSEMMGRLGGGGTGGGGTP